MARFGDLDTQYFDDAGDPLVNGKIYFYESGTTTLKDTFADINQSIPNTNPVILTASGRQPNIFFNGTAKAVLVSNSDVQIVVRDPVGETATDFGDQWVATKTYNAIDVVLGSDGVYYRSLINGNQNNNPVTTSGFWTLLYSVEWNSGITYQEGSVVTYDGEQYQSLTNSNLNNNPSTSPASWTLLSFAWISTATYADNQNAVGSDGILYTSQQAANTGNDPTDPANRPTYWVGTSADAAASAAAAAASEAAAAASEAAAETAETNAETAQAAAEAAQAAAETAETNAETAETGAEAAQAAAEAAQSAAETAQANAETAETNAETAETNAETAQAAAEAAQLAAETAQTGAETAETNAETAQAAAEAAQAAAETAETNAETAETNAEAAQAAAEAAQSAAETAQTNAETAETNAAGSASDASGFADAAQASATAAAGSATDASDKYDEFDARYLGEKASDPSVDNQGGALVEGALYFNTTSDAMKVYDGASWVNVAPVATSVTVSQISDYTGDATTLNYTSNLSSDAQTQLDSKNALPILKGISYAANAGEFVIATASGITITLPASPSAGDTVTVKDGTGDAAANTFTVGRNGSNIAASATDLIFDKNYAEITMTYIDGTIGWSV